MRHLFPLVANAVILDSVVGLRMVGGEEMETLLPSNNLLTTPSQIAKARAI